MARTLGAAIAFGMLLTSCATASPPVAQATAPPRPWRSNASIRFALSHFWTGCSPWIEQEIPQRPPGGSATMEAGPKVAEVEGRIVSDSPAFSFALTKGWRLATAQDATRFEIYRPVTHALKEFYENPALRRDVAASVPVMSNMVLTMKFLRDRPTVLTDATGAYIAVVATERASTPYGRGDELSVSERERLWEDFARMIAERSPALDKPVLTLRSIKVTNYPDSAALMLVYTRADTFGQLVCSRIQFSSETATVAFEHSGTAEHPTRGLAALDAVARTFRFDRKP